MKYALAFCRRGFLGLITVERPLRVQYPNGEESTAWVGLHVIGGQRTTAGVVEVRYPGDRWASRSPRVIARLSDEDGRRIEAELKLLGG